MDKQMPSKGHIVLAGFMGSGKTTIGRVLAEMMSVDQIDTDKVIEEKMQMSISEIFKQHGEAYFRDLEAKTIEEIDAYEKQLIICTGGGTILNERNVTLLKKHGVIVWLKVSPEVVFERVKEEHTRPLLKDDMSIEHIERILLPRMPLYEKAADIIILTDGKSIQEIGLEIVEKVRQL